MFCPRFDASIREVMDSANEMSKKRLRALSDSEDVSDEDAYSEVGPHAPHGCAGVVR